MSISNYLENLILDKVFNNSDFTISSLYVALHTGDPGETGANELVGGSYARQSASFAAASSGTLSNDADITYSNLPTCTITYISVWDSLNSGNMLWSGTTTASKSYTSGDTGIIYIGNLQITLD